MNTTETVDKNNPRTIQQDLEALEVIENDLIHILNVVQQVTEAFSKPTKPDPELKKLTIELTRDYYTTVDRMCDSLSGNLNLIKNYRESYRHDSTVWLSSTVEEIKKNFVYADEAANLELSKKKTN